MFLFCSPGPTGLQNKNIPAVKVRIDKWLWSIRIFKSRTIATDVVKTGRVRVNDVAVKPSFQIAEGDVVTVKKDGFNFQFRVLKTIEKRVGSPIALTCYEDLTPPEEYERRKRNQEAGGIQRDPGAGRPTKKDRRLLEAFLRIPPPE